jgi:dethiobiotin synthetase
MRKLPRQIFVSGIGTGIGKTIASAILTEALQGDYWKPIQAGNLDTSDTYLVHSLVSNPVSKCHPETYRFKTASSPHYAAGKEKIKIELSRFQAPVTERALIIEGAGGLMVPLNEEAMVIDLIKVLNVPVILIARNYLGCINHTLLSVEALRQRNIELLGIIFCGANFLDNEEIIEHFTKVPVLHLIDEAQLIGRRFVRDEANKLRTSLSQHFEF